MDSLLHAALEAEDILNKVKTVNVELLQSESSKSEAKMTWSNEKLHIPDQTEDNRMRYNRNLMSSSSKVPEKFDIFKKLHELYAEICRNESLHTNNQGLKITSYLLEKLLARINLNTLIINLYPGNKGYSISLKINGTTQCLNPPDSNSSHGPDDPLLETPRWPYEEEELLSYIDNEELPVVLLDLLESEHSCLFYSGCIIAQIRDYRQAYPSFVCDTHHVLLRPTTQSVLTDAWCVGGRCGWGGEERVALEAAMVLATAPPLCLDPRPAVGVLAARLHSAPRLLNTPRIRRQARRYSQVAVNRKRKLDQFTQHHGIELLDLINRHRSKNRQVGPHARMSSKFPKKPPEVFKPIEPPRMDLVPLALPSDPSAPLRAARAYERPRPVSDCQPILVEEYVLETEKSSPHGGAGFFHIKLSILQRPSDQEFLGELYVDRDHIEGERNGAACRFSLGSRVHANKYIQQFTEIFTEEGRKSVRIKHMVPGQMPRVSFTPGMRELQGQQVLLQQRSAVQSATAVVQPHPTIPIVTTATSTTNIATHSTARSLPILAQLQSSGVVTADQQLLKQQPSPATPRLSPQVSVPSEPACTQAASNQLLAAQLTNPPQPLNPQKLHPLPHHQHHPPAGAIIHIQHPLISSHQTHQVSAAQVPVGSQYATSVAPAQPKAAAAKPRTTNPAISALVTSLMNSAQQFQQASANAKANAGSGSSNATILNLLNSAPAAMTQGAGAGAGAAVGAGAAARLLAASAAPHLQPQPTHTYTHQIMSGFNVGGAGGDVGESVLSVGGARDGSEASLLSAETGEETAVSAAGGSTQPQLHLQGVSLASLGGLQGVAGVGGVQNVQVQIPGLAAPISLSLNVSGAPGAPLLVSVPPTTSVVLANQPSLLSLPIAQLVSGGVKGGVRAGVQLVRGRAPPPRPARPNAPAPSHSPSPQASVQFVAQSPQQVMTTHQVRRKSNPSDGSQ